MRYNFIFLLSILLFNNLNCQNNKVQFSTVEISDILIDETLNIRALEVSKDKSFAYVASSNGKVFKLNFLNTSNNINKSLIKVLQLPEISSNKNIVNIRSLEIVKNTVFVANISSPAHIFKFENNTFKTVYSDHHPDAFIDSMIFLDDSTGIAVGDSTEGCLSIMLTNNGGNSWRKISCSDIVGDYKKESAFAASDTNISVIGAHIWIITAGKNSRILHSSDKGNHWETYAIPIINKEETSGAYSIDFYDENFGFIIGGDYSNPDANFKNKAYTVNGGKTWQVVANNTNPGYRSCVQYVPQSNAKSLVTVGFKGVDCSFDNGKTWKHLSDEGFYTIRFINENTAIAAGKGRVSLLNFK